MDILGTIIINKRGEDKMKNGVITMRISEGKKDVNDVNFDKKNNLTSLFKAFNFNFLSTIIIHI